MTYRRERQMRKEADRKVDALLDKIYSDFIGVVSDKDNGNEENDGEPRHTA